VRRNAIWSLVLAGLVLTGCGRSSSAASGSTKLTILAASSLTKVLPRIGSMFAKDHPGVTFGFSFAGTDQLAAQVQQGAPADVFAGASTKFGDQLASAGLIEPYRSFCTNRLVLVVPASNPAGITSLGDLASKPVKLVIGSETVPVGSYTRTVLANLDAVFGPGYSASVLRKVVSNEDSVTSILAKVQSGEADAGFVYVTDALAAGSQLRSFALPAQAQAVATYPIAVVKASRNLSLARGFDAFVLSAPAQRVLRGAGFGPPPAS
jgi:molybdate transport system substrate-binding protein